MKITITVKIKKPPKGWKYQDRAPYFNEDYRYFDCGWSHICQRYDYSRRRQLIGGIYAYRIHKGKK